MKNKDRVILTTAFEFIANYVAVNDDPGTIVSQMVELVSSNIGLIDTFMETVRCGETLDVS